MYSRVRSLGFLPRKDGQVPTSPCGPVGSRRCSTRRADFTNHRLRVRPCFRKCAFYGTIIVQLPGMERSWVRMKEAQALFGSKSRIFWDSQWSKRLTQPPKKTDSLGSGEFHGPLSWTCMFENLFWLRELHRIDHETIASQKSCWIFKNNQTPWKTIFCIRKIRWMVLRWLIFLPDTPGASTKHSSLLTFPRENRCQRRRNHWGNFTRCLVMIEISRWHLKWTKNISLPWGITQVNHHFPKS